jgi:uncharacterized membrane protein (DUF2068 family)
MQIGSAVRGIAVLEASKGLLVLLVGLGAHLLVHHDAQLFAEQLVGHLHLNPAKASPRIFIEFAGKLTDTRLATLAALAMVYACARFVEAYGLWRKRRWAEWFAAASGAIYVPFEIYELLRGWDWLAFGALVFNIAVVVLMLAALFRAPNGPIAGGG